MCAPRGAPEDDDLFLKSRWRCLIAAPLLLLALAACGGDPATVLPTAVPAPAAQGAAEIAAARADVQAAVALARAGQPDAAYEKAAAVYLDRIENLEPALLKVDKDFVPVLEGDFKALRDAIKAGAPPADLDVIVTRLNTELDQAAILLAR
jgi:hypothetical protein